MEIAEIFYSIQGESTFAGFPCVFIRLSGCNLHCSYCDTQYAVLEPGKAMTVDDILAQADLYPNALVEITGGEPLLQQNVYALMDRLVTNNRKVLIETNGSLDISAIPIDVTVIMDIKCPDSGSNAMHHENIETIHRRAALRKGATEIKFVLSSLADYIWAKELTIQYDLSGSAPVLFSPVKNRLPVEDLASAILNDELPVRLQLQLHPIIWPNIQRGV